MWNSACDVRVMFGNELNASVVKTTKLKKPVMFDLTFSSLLLSTLHTNLSIIQKIKNKKSDFHYFPSSTLSFNLPFNPDRTSPPPSPPPSLWWVQDTKHMKKGSGSFSLQQNEFGTWWLAARRPPMTEGGITWVPRLCSWTWEWRWRSWGRVRVWCSWSSQCRSGSVAGRPPRQSSEETWTQQRWYNWMWRWQVLEKVCFVCHGYSQGAVKLTGIPENTIQQPCRWCQGCCFIWSEVLLTLDGNVWDLWVVILSLQWYDKVFRPFT